MRRRLPPRQVQMQLVWRKDKQKLRHSCAVKGPTTALSYRSHAFLSDGMSLCFRCACVSLGTILPPLEDKHPQLLGDYKAYVENQISTLCMDITSLMENSVIKSSTRVESKVFFSKLAGDFYRYCSEVIADKNIRVNYEKKVRATTSPEVAGVTAKMAKREASDCGCAESAVDFIVLNCFLRVSSVAILLFHLLHSSASSTTPTL
jgi:hypothetical protein